MWQYMFLLTLTLFHLRQWRHSCVYNPTQRASKFLINCCSQDNVSINHIAKIAKPHSSIFFSLSSLKRVSSFFTQECPIKSLVHVFGGNRPVMTRRSCVILFSSLCFVWTEELSVMNFTYHSLHCGWPMSFVTEWPVVFFFNKSRGETKQVDHQSSCQDLTLWLP